MTLKKGISINIALGFSLAFGLASFLIFFSFWNFRKEEFKDRLEEKALTTAKLLVEVKEVDNQLLKLIDKNTIYKLYNEKTLVFDKNLKLIYSSIDDASIDWNQEDLINLKTNKSFYRKDKEKDLIGLFYSYQGTEYYILVAAEDKYGNNKLQFLFYSLLITFFGGVLLIWVGTYYLIKKLLKPLDNFQQEITNLSASKLHKQLPTSHAADEISLLTKAYNQMLIRIESAFNQQKEFSANASHELRTPLTRLSFQIENLAKIETHSLETRQYLTQIKKDVNQLADLINSLLILSKIDNDSITEKYKTERIDEIIFEAIDLVKKQDSTFLFDFEIKENQEIENLLEVACDKSLIEIVFVNLLRNACAYSDDKKAHILLDISPENRLSISILNNGKTLTEKEESKLFQPFMRGANASQKYGSGLGLRIVKRILDYHHYEIKYSSPIPNTNIFTILILD